MFLRMVLPVLLTFGTRGGPRFATDKVEVENGHEYRNQRWAYPRHEYEARYNSRVSYEDIVAFIGAAAGSAHSFLAIDPLNFEAAVGEGLFVDSDGSPQGKQMIKRIMVSGYPYDILVTKPYPDVVIDGGGTLDEDTGIVYGGDPVGWSGGFWKQVRSVNDNVTPIIDAKAMGGISGDPAGYILGWEPIQLIEVHDEEDEAS